MVCQNFDKICISLKMGCYLLKFRGMGVRSFKKFGQKGSEFFLLALCTCFGGGGGQVHTSPSVKKITDPLF